MKKLVTILRLGAKFLMPIVVIGVAVMAMKMLVATKPEVKRRPSQEQTYAVQLQKVEPADHQPDIVLYGTVSASRTVELRALVGGEVIWVNPALEEGQIIEAGDALVRIDPFDYEGAVREAEANLAEAKAKLAASAASMNSEKDKLERLKEQQVIARADLDRAQQLVKSGSVTRQTLESRKLTLSQRQQAAEASQNKLMVQTAEIEQLKANFDRLEWKLEQARRNLKDTELKAPFRGLITKKNVDLGRLVSGSDALVAMYDPAQMDVRFTLSDAQYGRLTSDGRDPVGRTIKVNWRLGDTVRSHTARIERITAEVNAANGGIDVYARLEEQSGLRAGTFVELVVPDKIYKNAIVIPQAAIYSGNIVFSNDNGRMKPHKVKVLAYLGEKALIDASPFEPGTELISTRVAEAGLGLKITVPGTSKQAGATKAAPTQSKAQAQTKAQAKTQTRTKAAEGTR